MAKQASKKVTPRKIELIILHCSDSDNPNHDNPETIRKWHTERGFVGPDGIIGSEDDIGYHFVITKDGKIHNGRPVESIGAHCKDHNKNSIGICLTGRRDFTPEQFASARKLVNSLFKEYGLDWRNVKPHNEFDSSKTCPNYKVLDVING